MHVVSQHLFWRGHLLSQTCSCVALNHAVYAGNRSEVEFPDLQAADNLARFACAVYAVAPIHEDM